MATRKLRQFTKGEMRQNAARVREFVEREFGIAADSVILIAVHKAGEREIDGLPRQELHKFGVIEGDPIQIAHAAIHLCGRIAREEPVAWTIANIEKDLTDFIDGLKAESEAAN
jgi:hypothetical protein